MSQSSLARTAGATVSFTRRYARYIFWLLWLANFINYADRYAFLAIGDHVQTEFNLSDTQYGLLATSFLFVYTLSILPMGLLADRVKRKNVVAGGITFWSIVTTFTALAPNYGFIFATRVTIPARQYIPERTLGPIWAAAFDAASRRFMSRIATKVSV